MALNNLRLDRIVLVSADPERLAAFYTAAFGFERLAAEAIGGADAERRFGRGVRHARIVPMRLGGQRVDLVAPDPLGAPCSDVPGWDPLFQHFAIIVSDMAVAFTRLSACDTWTPISRDGPQVLPDASGGVTAFKFRDPEGHPLELLAFPPGKAPDPWRGSPPGAVCLGIDHSAISVADSARSIRFYESLGLNVVQSSHNVGPEQACLDDVDSPDVLVTGLACPGRTPPHVELLCYRGGFVRSAAPPGLTDIAATRLAFAGRPARPSGDALSGNDLVRDPDGHLLEFTIDPSAP